jgi:hypothetical protein
MPSEVFWTIALIPFVTGGASFGWFVGRAVVSTVVAVINLKMMKADYEKMMTITGGNPDSQEPTAPGIGGSYL